MQAAQTAAQQARSQAAASAAQAQASVAQTTSQTDAVASGAGCGRRQRAIRRKPVRPRSAFKKPTCKPRETNLAQQRHHLAGRRHRDRARRLGRYDRRREPPNADALRDRARPEQDGSRPRRRRTGHRFGENRRERRLHGPRVPEPHVPRRGLASAQEPGHDVERRHLHDGRARRQQRSGAASRHDRQRDDRRAESRQRARGPAQRALVHAGRSTAAPTRRRRHGAASPAQRATRRSRCTGAMPRRGATPRVPRRPRSSRVRKATCSSQRNGKLVRVPVSITLVSGTQAAVAPAGDATLAAGDQVVTGDGAAAPARAQRAPSRSQPAHRRRRRRRRRCGGSTNGQRRRRPRPAPRLPARRRAGDRAGRGRSHDRSRGVRRRDGAVGFGQVDLHAHRRIPRPADRGLLRLQRARRHRTVGRRARRHPQPRDGLRLPSLQLAAAHERGRKRRAADALRRRRREANAARRRSKRSTTSAC